MNEEMIACHPYKKKKTIEIDPSTIMKKKDRTECMLTNGDKAIYYSNGSIKIIQMNQVSIIYFENGDIKITYPNKKVSNLLII